MLGLSISAVLSRGLVNYRWCLHRRSWLFCKSFHVGFSVNGLHMDSKFTYLSIKNMLKFIYIELSHSKSRSCNVKFVFCMLIQCLFVTAQSLQVMFLFSSCRMRQSLLRPLLLVAPCYPKYLFHSRKFETSSWELRTNSFKRDSGFVPSYIIRTMDRRLKSWSRESALR